MLDDRQIQGKSDEELVVLALKDQDYFLYLMKRYEKKLLGYILKISNISQDEAEDILQDVFIKVYRNLNNFDTNLKFSSWIYRITRNQVISNHRKNKARPQSIKWDAEINDEILNNLAADFDISQEVDLRFLQENIKQILNNLDKKYREVLVLKFLEEKTYQEISDILKKPAGTVATLINRAKKQFKKEVKRQSIKLETG